jgi:hypothetical protein
MAKKRRSSKQKGSSRTTSPQLAKEWQSSGMVDDDDDDGWGDDSERAPGSAMIMDGKRLPAVVRCFDTARIYIKSGDGGAGCVAFRREPYVEKGGPNGGNGGRGGNVWAVADDGINSLLPFRNQAHFRAQNGSAGGHSTSGVACHKQQRTQLLVKTLGAVSSSSSSSSSSSRSRSGGAANLHAMSSPFLLPYDDDFSLASLTLPLTTPLLRLRLFMHCTCHQPPTS